MKKTIVDTWDIIDKIVQTKYSKRIEDLNIKDVCVSLDGPNVIFKTGAIQYRLAGLGFKKGTKQEYENFLGESGILIEIPGKRIKEMRYFDKDINYILEEKFEKAIKIFKLLYKNSDFYEKKEGVEGYVSFVRI